VRLAQGLRPVIDRFLPRGALILSVLVFGNYLLAYGRNFVFARTYGAGSELDAYNAAFVIPELTLGVLVASGLAAPFVPLFVGLKREDEAAAETFGQTILTGAVIVMGAAGLILFVLAPQTAALIAPGFGAEQRALYVELFRLMLFTPVIFAASLALGEVLIAERRFVYYGAAPALYQIGIIVGTLTLSDRLGIHAAAVGAVLGALMFLGIRVWGARRAGFRIRPRLAVRMPAIGSFVRLMLPKMVSQPTDQLTFLFFTAVASGLAAGSISIVNFARDFPSAWVSLIGVSFSLAAFPALSAAFSSGDRRRFVSTLGSNLISVTILGLVATIGLLVFGRLVLGLYRGGEFDEDDLNLTVLVLSAFAISVPLESLTHLLSRAIYATRHTLLQVAASLVGFATTIGVTVALAPQLAVLAIPIGFSVGMAVKVVLLAIVLAWRLRRFRPEPLAQLSGSAVRPG
jgi:putative peptidoglycan lipid II flippase